MLLLTEKVRIKDATTEIKQAKTDISTSENVKAGSGPETTAIIGACCLFGWVCNC